MTKATGHNGARLQVKELNHRPALFDCPRPSDYGKIADRIHRALEIAVD